VVSATLGFAIPKEEGSPRIIYDFRYCNSQLARNSHPILNIHELLHKCSGFTYMTKIHTSMAYNTFEWNEESQNLCIKYKYLRLPMGISATPDFLFQTVMSQLLGFKKKVKVFFDDVSVSSPMAPMKIIFKFVLKSSRFSKRLDSLTSQRNVLGLHSALNTLAASFCQMVFLLFLTRFNSLSHLRPRNNFVHLLACSTTTRTCGLTKLTS